MKTLVDLIRERVVHVARSNVGYGEQGSNNAGKFIHAIGGNNGDEWCALFAGYCYRRAHQILELDPPEWAYRRKGVPEKGAKRLTRNLARVGRRFSDPAQARPGDLVCWSRGRLGWQGHVGVVLYERGGIITSIEGNVGRYPSKVRLFQHDVTKERLYMFASMER